jgi:hypothetical protein
MLILETQDLPDLSVRQGCFVFPHLPRDLDVRVELLEDLFGWLDRGDRVVCGVEDLNCEF